MYTQTFDVIDLINLVAADHDWDLCFDSGPGDTRELIFSRTSRFGIGLEVEIVLDFTGQSSARSTNAMASCCTAMPSTSGPRLLTSTP